MIALGVVFASIIYLMVGWYLVKFIFIKFTGKLWLRILRYFVLFLIYLFPFSDAMLSNAILNYLCIADSGTKYLERPSIQSGLFFKFNGLDRSYKKYLGCDDVCLDLLFSKEYPFIEYFVNSSSKGYLDVEWGYTQYSLSSVGDERCAQFESARSSGEFKFSHYFDGSGKCLAIEKSVNQKARITFEFEREDFEVLSLEFQYVFKKIVEDSTKLLALSTNVIVISSSAWFLPFLYKKQCDVDAIWFHEFQPNNYWSKYKVQ